MGDGERPPGRLVERRAPVRAAHLILRIRYQAALECVVTDIRITETMFNSALAPVRADVNVTLAVMEDDNNVLYQLDKLHRNVLAALGLQNIRIF